MKSALLTLSLLGLVMVAPVRAGDEPAGPAAASAPGVGSIITPGSHALLGTYSKDTRQNRIRPGQGGAVVLAADQVERTAAALAAFAGATTEGNTVLAPTVMADGTPATIALNKQSGVLSIVRKSD